MQNLKLTKPSTAKIRQHVWAAAAAAISIYFSIVFAAGIIVGYFGTKLFNRKICGRSIMLSVGARKLHVHHWIMGGLALGGIAVFSSFHDCPRLILGGIGGIIVEDFKDIYQPVLNWLKRKTLKKD